MAFIFLSHQENQMIVFKW